MALRADRHDYSRAFEKHYKAYCAWNSSGHLESQSIILFYCVECGLKFLLMRKLKLYKTKDANQSISNILKSHDLINLLKELHQNRFSFQKIKTKHDEDVSLTEYHQMRRYCIEVKSEKYNEIRKQYDENLRSVAQWIYEERWAKQ